MLFDHLVGERNQFVRYGEAERLGGREVTLQERTDAARSVIGDRIVALHREDELPVLGGNATLRLRLAARLEPRDQFLAGFDRRHVDLVASHAALPAKGPRPYTAAVRESNWSCTARAAQRRVICLQPRAYVRPASVFLISSPHT